MRNALLDSTSNKRYVLVSIHHTGAPEWSPCDEHLTLSQAVMIADRYEYLHPYTTFQLCETEN